MEATQSLVAALLEAQGYFVAADYKVKANDISTFGGQSHDIDLDIVALDTSGDSVLVGEVKSYWGSTGVRPEQFVSEWTDRKGPHSVFKIVNNKDRIQPKLWQMLKRQLGREHEFQYVVFAGRIRNEVEVRKRLGQKRIFGKPVELTVIRDLLEKFIGGLRTQEKRSFSYVNHPAVAAILALQEYGLLKGD
jgi:hypothetical protein